MTSRNQGLSSNDQRRQRRETLGTRLRIYILIIKVNKLFSLLSSWCLLKEIENMFSVFLSSCRYTHESLALLPACSHSISGSLWPRQRCNTCFAMCYGKVLPHPHVTFVWISLDCSNLAPKSNRIERSRLWANLSSGKRPIKGSGQNYFAGSGPTTTNKSDCFCLYLPTLDKRPIVPSITFPP